MNGKGLEHKVVLLGLELGSSQSYWKKNSKSHYYHLHNQLHWKYWFPAFQRNQPSLNLSRWSGVAKAARLQRLRSLGKQCPFLPKTMNIGQVFFFFLGFQMPSRAKTQQWAALKVKSCMRAKGNWKRCLFRLRLQMRREKPSALTVTAWWVWYITFLLSKFFIHQF